VVRFWSGQIVAFVDGLPELLLRERQPIHSGFL